MKKKTNKYIGPPESKIITKHIANMFEELRGKFPNYTENELEEIVYLHFGSKTLSETIYKKQQGKNRTKELYKIWFPDVMAEILLKKLRSGIKLKNSLEEIDKMHIKGLGFDINNLCNGIPRGAKKRIEFGKRNTNFQREPMYKLAVEIIELHNLNKKTK